MPDAPKFAVQRLRGGFAIVFLRGGKRVRRQLTATDRPSAEAEARALWIGTGNSPWTVGRCMTAYLASIQHKTSHQRRKDAWKALEPFWARVDPAVIDEAMCRSYATKRRAGSATVRYELMQVSTALGWAHSNGNKIARRPQIWLPSAPEHKVRALDRSDFTKFFAAVKADHARTYVMLGLFTMARPSAILELTWDRVDFMRRRIDFTPPNHVRTAKRRTVIPIADELLPELQRAHAARTTEFVIERGGQPVACIKKAFQAASQRSDVHATPYTLRHTGAVWAAEAGISMDELAQFLGHDDARTTAKHYARYSPDYLSRVANAITLKA